MSHAEPPESLNPGWETHSEISLWLGNATQSTHSCTSFSLKLAQTAPAQKFLSLIQTLTVCSWSQGDQKRLIMQDTYTKRSMAEDLAMSDSKKLSLILIQTIKNSQHWKNFPLRALFLLVTVVVWKSCWNMEPYDHQKMLCSFFI